MRRVAPFAPICFVLAFAAHAAALGPSETVRQATDAVLRILKDPEVPKAERWRRIAPIIGRNFDFRAMSQSVLATRWQSATPDQQREFTDYFSQYLEHTYREKIEAYTNQRVEYGKETVRDDRAVVNTTIVTDSTAIPVSYRMRRRGSEWLAYDVIIEGVSLVSNYRQIYAAIGQSGGVQGILNDIEGRVNRLQSSGADSRKTQ